MERDELRTTLVNHLETLRRNLQVVSMEVLKTKYKKPFDVLRQDICKAATAYTRFLVFDGMRIKHKYFDEAVPYIDAAVKQTKRLKQMDCQHFFRQIFLGYFSDIVQAFDTLRKNVCGDDYTSLHNPIVLSSVLPAYGMFHSIQILFL